jgi:hypothetical protein
VSQWVFGAGGSVVSAGDGAVSEWVFGAGGSVVSAGDGAVSEWVFGAGGSVVSAGDVEMLGRKHRPGRLKVSCANKFWAAFPIPVDEAVWRWHGLKL